MSSICGCFQDDNRTQRSQRSRSLCFGIRQADTISIEDRIDPAPTRPHPPPPSEHLSEIECGSSRRTSYFDQAELFYKSSSSDNTSEISETDWMGPGSSPAPEAETDWMGPGSSPAPEAEVVSDTIQSKENETNSQLIPFIDEDSTESTQEEFIHDTVVENIYCEHRVMHLFTLDKHPKIINIRSAITEAVLIQVEFPIYSTLGERSIHFEVVTDDDAFNLPAHQSLLTPVLYFSQSTNAAFLRPVKVKLLLSETSFDGSYDIQRGNLDQDCEIKDDYCVIKSFSFCPIALIKDSLRHTLISSLQIERKLLFDSNMVYFMLRQNEPQHGAQDTFSLRLECRKFRDWIEHDFYRWKPNYFYQPVMRHSTEQEILKVPIKVIEPGHLIMKHRSYEFSFLIKHNEQASAVQLASQPDLYEEPQTLNYKFKDDAYTAGTDIHFEYFKVKSILFPKFKEKSHFKLLSREGLYDIPTEPFLKKEKLVDFLQNIGCHWFEFMTKKIVVRPEYLKELMILDFKLAVEDFLQKKTAPTHETIEERSLRMQNYEKHIFQMLEIDKIAKLTRGELMIETNPKLRVQIMCDEQFKAYADINLKSAKEKSLFDCFGLSGESCALENQTLQMMAEIMILMDNQKLNLDMRRFQGEFYELNEALLREKLLDIPPGQDLESC